MKMLVEPVDLRTQTKFAFGSGDVGAKTVFVAAFDGYFDSDAHKDLGQFGGVHAHHREIVEFALLGSIL